MNNHKLKFSITSEDIYNKFSENEKSKINNIKITKAELINNETVIIECMLLTEPVINSKYIYKLIGEGNIQLD